MSDLDKTPQEELKEKLWMGATRLVVSAFLFGSGYLAAYLQFGDAIELREKVKQNKDRIVDLENERETMSTRMAKTTRDKEVCEKELKGIKGTPPAE